MIDAKTFAERMNMRRNMKGLSLRGLAEKCGCTGAAMANYGNGLRLPPLDVAEQIAIALDTTLDWLCGHDETAKAMNYGDALRQILAVHATFAGTKIDLVDMPCTDDLSTIKHLLTDGEDSTTRTEIVLHVPDETAAAYLKQYQAILALEKIQGATPETREVINLALQKLTETADKQPIIRG